MTLTHHLKLSIVSGTMLALSLGVGAFPAQALTVGADVSAAASTKSATADAKAVTKMQTVVTKANSDIAARITALNNLNTRIAGLKNVSATQKSNIATDVQTNISGLTALQTKIDADTDAATLKTDTASIFGTFRIYALVIPQGYILSAADRVTTIAGMMTTISSKFAARITAAQTAGQNVTSLSASLADMNEKVADAQAQATLASSGVGSLTPDQGNKTTLASNHAALLAARANIKTATADLKAARADASTILKGLKVAL